MPHRYSGGVSTRKTWSAAAHRGMEISGAIPFSTTRNTVAATGRPLRVASGGAGARPAAPATEARDRPSAARLDPLRERLQPVHAPRREHDRGALARERDRRPLPEAGGRAGDDRDRVLQL